MATNITYVSALMKIPSPQGPEQRIPWLRALLSLDIPLILFVDATYADHIRDLPRGPKTQVHLLEFEDLETTKRVRAAGPLDLPPNRNPHKDTLEFFILMNAKPEFLERARPHVQTPYVAFLDAGIRKICSTNSTLTTLQTLRVQDIPLVLLPGCWPVRPVANPYPDLWRGINWTFCGGFFIVPVGGIQEWLFLCRAGLETFLERNCITWEVNVWTAFASRLGERLVWFSADHNDSMLTAIPRPYKIA